MEAKGDDPEEEKSGCEREETVLGAASDDVRPDGIQGTSEELVSDGSTEGKQS